jgi:hypothetical protein
MMATESKNVGYLSYLIYEQIQKCWKMGHFKWHLILSYKGTLGGADKIIIYLNRLLNDTAQSIKCR